MNTAKMAVSGAVEPLFILKYLREFKLSIPNGWNHSIEWYNRVLNARTNLISTPFQVSCDMFSSGPQPARESPRVARRPPAGVLSDYFSSPRQDKDVSHCLLTYYTLIPYVGISGAHTPILLDKSDLGANHDLVQPLTKRPFANVTETDDIFDLALNPSDTCGLHKTP